MPIYEITRWMYSFFIQEQTAEAKVAHPLQQLSLGKFTGERVTAANSHLGSLGWI